MFARIALVTTALAIAATFAVVSVQAAGPGDRGPMRYVVVLNDNVPDPAAAASAHSKRYGVQVGFVYSAALKGYSAVIPNDVVAALRTDSSVAFMEPDFTAEASAQTVPWGIDRIDADISSTKAGDGSGTVSNVKVYVIDSGVASHSDLNIVSHVNFAGGKNTDCNGHGTHVAGTIAAKDNTSDVVGVAPGAPIAGVKVLGCSGSGSYSGVIAGVDWVTSDHQPGQPAIANMSLGGPVSAALDQAVRNSVADGVVYSLAAGNSGADACNSSPARTGTTNGVITVAATDSGDNETSWSNYGSCVDIWGPGASILSTRRGGGTTTMSGTSMASPHAGGTAALYLSRQTSSSPATVESALKTSAFTTSKTSKDGRTVKVLNAGGY